MFENQMMENLEGIRVAAAAHGRLAKAAMNHYQLADAIAIQDHIKATQAILSKYLGIDCHES